MTSVPIDQIRARVVRVDIARLVLTLLACVPYALGWFTGASVRAVEFTIAAVRIGWRDGRGRQTTRGAGAQRPAQDHV